MEVFEQILYMGGAASVVIIAVLLVRVLLKHFSRKYAYFLWLIVGIRLICPIAVSSSLSVFNLQFLPEQGMEAWMAAVEDVPEEIFSGPEEVFRDTVDVLPDETSKVTVTEGDYKSVSTAHSFDTSNGMKEAGAGAILGEDASADSFQETGNSSVISKVLSAAARIWLTGMVLLLLWNAYLTVRMRRRLRKAVLYRDNIYECDGIATPFVFGLLRPRIYIPFRLGEEEREYILHHEQYHIRRRDYIAKVAAFLILTVYWFHPLVWVSYFCMIRDMEMSCDEYVLASMGQDIRKEYSQSLLAFATNQRHMSMGLLAFGETGTRKRIRHILNFHKKGKWMGILAGIVVLVAAAACLTNGTTEGSGNKGSGIQIASEMVNGYDTRLLLQEGEKIVQPTSPYNGMYGGRFVLATYKAGEKCDEQELAAPDGEEKLYFPEKFSLCVQDYDEDGRADDFALAQLSGSSAMAYCFYTVEENGSIMKYNVSVQNSEPDDGTIIRERPAKNGEDYIIADESSSGQDSQRFSPELPVKYGILSYSSYEPDTGKSKENACILIKRLDKDRSPASELDVVKKTEEMMGDIAPQRIVEEIPECMWMMTREGENKEVYTCTKGEDTLDKIFCIWIGVEDGKMNSYSLISDGIKKEIPEDPVTEDQAYETVQRFAKAFSGKELTKEELQKLSSTSQNGADLNLGDIQDSSFLTDDNGNKLVLSDSQGGIYTVDMKHNMVEQFQNSGQIGIDAEDLASAEKVESVENQIRIGFWRPEDGAAEPVYYGGGEELERLQDLAEKLDSDHGCTKAVLKKWQKEKQTGYILSYKGNDWEVYTGGYVAFAYGKDEKEDPEKNAIMYLPELCKEAERICKTELNYQRIEPSEIKDVVSAELSYKKKDGTYEKQTVKDKSKLRTLEDVLSKAEDMKGSSACPFGSAVLTLQLRSGREIQLTWAEDDCRVIRINGVYYEYMDRHLSFSPYGIRALFNKIPWRSMS